jgi:AraC family transcriptional regulator of adaptative response/methylated-DNA-[protein]-cysteine methyltransferase
MMGRGITVSLPEETTMRAKRTSGARAGEGVGAETLPALAGDEARWRAVEQRDRGADGQFVYSVATTGVYCRPGCPSRRPLRRNVAFHASPAAARRAGFRACKRCRPDEPARPDRHAEAAVRACRILEAADTIPSLETLAGEVGLSRYHFHRVFKKTVGVTPRQYAAAHRAERVQAGLRAAEGSGSTASGTITRAIYGAGFGSSGRFYERAPELLGMTPGQYRGGGPGVAIRYAIAPCTLGLVLVAGTARGLCAVRLGDDRGTLEAEFRRDFSQAAIELDGDGALDAWVRAVVARIEQPAQSADPLPLDIRGTAFQQRVWQALRAIPPGQTASYAEIAARIGRPSAARAVARACATNPAAIVVPCHRVVGKSGELTGYRWGLERKRQLLEREGAL